MYNDVIKMSDLDSLDVHTRIKRLEKKLEETQKRLYLHISINQQNQEIISSLERQIINNYDSGSSCTAFIIGVTMCFTPIVISWFV
tara:strand:- start:755 stop:1012 length:258 start_codon:yes stop_codon:yes gene_type:complete